MDAKNRSAINPYKSKHLVLLKSAIVPARSIVLLAKAVTLLSGSLDSATEWAIARDQVFICHALSFDYGQRYGAELNLARYIARQARVMELKLMHVELDLIGDSALTDKRIAVSKKPQADDG
jgi:7-cyano-7-deazaguanine synthase